LTGSFGFEVEARPDFTAATAIESGLIAVFQTGTRSIPSSLSGTGQGT